MQVRITFFSVALRLNVEAIWGLPGYTFMGIYKELQKQLGSSSHNYIIAARTAQGYEEWRSSSLEERLDVVSQWHSIQTELDKEKQQARHNSFHAHYRLLKTRHMSFDDRNKTSRDKKAKKEGERKKARAEDYNRSEATSSVLHHARTYPAASTAYSDAAAFEEAIQNSVAATSQGNSEQDKLIERAIRASVLELRSAAQEGDNNDALQRAIQASIVEATRTRNENMNTQSPLNLSEDLNHEEQLRDALQRSISMRDEIHAKKHQGSISMVDFDDSDVDTDDDDNIKAAIEQSKKIDIV